MDLSSASSVALSLRIVGQQLSQTWNSQDDRPMCVEDLYEVCRRQYAQLTKALMTEDDHTAVVTDLLEELVEIRVSYGQEPAIEDEVALLLDSVRLSLKERLTVQDFLPVE